MSTVLTNTLYSKVEKSLSDKGKMKEFQVNLDKYMAKYADVYSAIGPYKRPIFSDKDIDDLIGIAGLTRNEIKEAVKDSPDIKSQWVEATKPFNIAICLVLRYFIIKGDKENIDKSLSYLIVSMYPIMHYRYYRFEPNEAAMTYTINNLSNKFNLKQAKSLWVNLMDIARVCLNHFEKKIKAGKDEDIAQYINSNKTRLNSFLKKITNEYTEVFKSKKYLGKEYESFEEDNYHEANSDSYAIGKVTNKVVSSLVVNGPNMRLVTMCANNCKISANLLRSYLSTMIANEQREDIEKIIESLIYLYVQPGSPEAHNISGVGTTSFLIHCMKVYKKSNTIDEHVVHIKAILDKWLDELGLREHTSNGGTLNNFRKAIYMFFVMSIINSN